MADRLCSSNPQVALAIYAKLKQVLSPRNQAVVTVSEARVKLECWPGAEEEGHDQMIQALADALDVGSHCAALQASTSLARDALQHPHGMEQAEHWLGGVDLTRCAQPNARADHWHQIGAARRQRGDMAGRLNAILNGLAAGASGASQLWLEFDLAEVRHDLGDINDNGETFAHIAESAPESEPILKLNALKEVAAIQSDQGLVDLAEVSWVRSRDFTLELTDPSDRTAELAVIDASLAELALRRGDVAAARQRLDAALAVDMSERVPRQRHLIEQATAAVALAGGDPQGARAIVERLLADPQAEPEVGWRASALLAQLEALQGRPRAARATWWKLITRLEDERARTEKSLPEIDWTSQRTGIYLAWIDQLVDDWSAAGERSRAAPGQEWDPRRVFVDGPITADDLLSAVEGISSRTLVAQLARDRGDLSGPGARPPPFTSGATLRAKQDVPVVVFQPLEKRLLILIVLPSGVTPILVDSGRGALAEAVRDLTQAFAGRPGNTPPAIDGLGGLLLEPIAHLLQDPDQPVGFSLHGSLIHLPLPALRLNGRDLKDLVIPFERPSLSIEPRHPPAAPGRAKIRALLVTSSTAPRAPPFASQDMDMLDPRHFELTRLDARTPEEVLDALPGYDLIHFALHGQPPVGAEVDADGVDAALSGGLRVGNGLLTAAALQRAKINARLVVLGTCMSRVGDGNYLEYAGGAVHRALIAAGVSTTIASGWKVGDRETSALLQALYTYYPTYGPAQALTLAQRAISRGIGVRPPWAPPWTRELLAGPPIHGDLVTPWEWAAFTAVGRWD